MTTRTTEHLLAEIVSTRRSCALEMRTVWRGLPSGIRQVLSHRPLESLQAELERDRIRLRRIREAQ